MASLLVSDPGRYRPSRSVTMRWNFLGSRHPETDEIFWGRAYTSCRRAAWGV